MGKKYPFQRQPWAFLNQTIAKNLSYRSSSPGNVYSPQMRLLNAFLLLVYLSATQCCMCQSLPHSPDSGQPSSNSLVQDGGNSRPVRSSVYGSSCMPQEYVEPVQATFQKLIPSFDSRSITILIKSGMKNTDFLLLNGNHFDPDIKFFF